MNKTAKIIIAALVIIAAIAGYYAYTTNKAAAEKEAEIAALEAKVDSLKLASRTKAEVRADAKAEAKAEKAEAKQAKAASKAEKDQTKTSSSVRAEYSVNVRKVEGAVVLPENQKHFRPGKVVVNVEVNFAGQVKRASVNTKESSVKYAYLHTDCRKAALSTIFESNPTQSRYTSTKGTITYYFE